MQVYCFVCLLVTTWKVQAKKQDISVMMSSIKRDYFKLFKSIQREASAISSATFETYCSNSGCFYNMVNTSRNGKIVSCDANVVTRLDSIVMKIDKLSNIQHATKCKKGFKINQNLCYKYVATKMNFFEAEMFCRTQQSSLTDICDANEEQWIRKLMEDPKIWTSGSDLAEHGEWKWLSSGLPMTFTNWTKGQPQNNQEHCLCVLKPSAWHDCSCILAHGLKWACSTSARNCVAPHDNQFDDSDAVYISDILHGDNILTELNLSHNNFSAEGGLIIGSALGCNETIKHLNLSWNHIRGRGAQAIGLGLQKNASIRILNVSWNGFDVAGCHGLSHGLSKNSTLVDLDLCSNRVGIIGLSKLVEGMKRNSTLEVLRIGNNPITAQGPMFILQSLKSIPNIKYIDLHLQPVDMDFVSSLITCQKTRDIHVTYGKVCLKPARGDEDSTMYIKGDPVTVMFEFTRMKDVDVLDLFITFDTDGSHSVTWEEFKEGVQVSKIPVRMRDLDTIIKRIDINLDGEINFSELMIAQKEHNLRVKRLMDKGERVFINSEVGVIHQELLDWFKDKGVFLKNYSFLSTLQASEN